MHSFNDHIGDMEKFNPDNYPTMAAELTVIIKDINYLPIYFKKDIVLSYVRDHCIRSEWSVANPDLSAVMTSGKLSTSNIEKLFDACRWNKTFRQDLERYVKERLN